MGHGLSLGAAVLLVLTGCGEERRGDMDVDDPAATAPEGLVQTQAPVTVLDDGDGPELCLGGVAESLPPQCGGPRLRGWDWAELDGHFEEAHGVRWGDFHVVGSYDGGGHDGVVTVEEVTPASEWGGEPPSYDEGSSTPCPEPAGGWQVVDPELTTTATLERVLRVAQQLEGYAGGWVDQSINPASDRLEDPDHAFTPEDERAMNDPTLTIVNVRVAADVAAAEAELRTVWGGPLCVSGADRTEAELRSIQQDLTTTPGFLSVGIDVGTGSVELSVIHDDGTLQDALDDEYGAGVVLVESASVPAT